MPSKLTQDLSKNIKLLRLLEGNLEVDTQELDPVYNFVEGNAKAKVISVSPTDIIFRIDLDDYASVNLQN